MSKPAMRRQYKSCDQCRRSKRACDAPFLNTNGTTVPLNRIPGSNDVAAQACSYCIKTRKKCTLEWATSLRQRNQTRSIQGETSRNKRKQSRSTDIDETGFHLFQGSLEMNFLDHSWGDVVQPVWESGGPLAPDYNTDRLFFDNGLVSAFSQQYVPPSVASASTVPPDANNVFPATTSETSSQEYLGVPDMSGVQWFENKEPNNQESWESACQPIAVAGNPESNWSDENIMPFVTEPNRRDSTPDQQASLIRYSISPVAPNASIASQFNSHFISSGLLKIYHDVLENNLTCWLTESTCPYKTGDTSLLRLNSQYPQVEWGPTWSNRMYGRTIELDKAALASGMIQTCRSEDRAASRALDLVIVAFAAQWAQGSQRQREQYSNVACYQTPSTGGSRGSSEPTEFDRRAQRELWEQARSALQQVSDVECFKVASAEIIFGLTQKPLNGDCESSSAAAELFICPKNGAGDLKPRILARLSSLISSEGPPVYIERAARKLQALKARFDASCQKCGTDMYVCGSKASRTRPFLSQENRATIDLLYWLAVMFDTISSSMSNRPVVVSDQESRQQPSASSVSQASTLQSHNDGTISRWDIGAFIDDNLHEPKKIPVWPCSYEEAADAIVRSAPVKVLLFRHISYLQSMIRNGVRGKSVEELIDTTTSVYRYWEMTYGSFFRTLVDNIDVIPFRIQSWFSCISAHWHLAALMLSDLIDFIDENELGTPFGTQCRSVMRTAAIIRDKTVKDLSDLATVSTPQDDAGQSKTNSSHEDFHHAVNGCVILTEPWTLILIRAFGAASAILLGSAEASIDDKDSLITQLAMAENCIKALWHLGKKSDLSRKSAEMLSVALNKLHVVLGAAR